MKKVLLMAALLGGVSFSSRAAGNKPNGEEMTQKQSNINQATAAAKEAETCVTVTLTCGLSGIRCGTPQQIANQAAKDEAAYCGCGC